jgi:hypothetical protein
MKQQFTPQVSILMEQHFPPQVLVIMDQHFVSQLFVLMKQHFAYWLPNHHLFFVSFLQQLQLSTLKKTTISLLIFNFNELDQKDQRRRKRKKERRQRQLAAIVFFIAPLP